MLKQKSFVNDKSSASLGTNTLASVLINIHRVTSLCQVLCQALGDPVMDKVVLVSQIFVS